MSSRIRVTVWGENVHEQENPLVAKIYPDGMHRTIARALLSAQFHWDHYVFQRGQRGQQLKILKNEPDHFITERRASILAQLAQASARYPHIPTAGHIQPGA